MKIIVEMKKEGLLFGALIKKKRYWPSLVSDNTISEYFETNQSVRQMLSVAS